jgi:stage II sporulation protein D
MIKEKNNLGNYLHQGFLFQTAIILIIIIWGCTAVPRLKEGSELSFIRLPFARVLIDNDVKEINISGVGQYAVECIRGEENYVYHSSQSMKVMQEDGRLTLYANKSRIGDDFDEIILSPRAKKGFLKYNNRRYRGMFRIILRGSSLRLINIVHIDDYLKGVVPPEMGPVGKEEFEAIKAQTIAARTYSLKRLSQYPGEPFDLRSDVTDQLYQGVESENELISEAIEQTRGYVIKYGDSLITAYYHSTCGGNTDQIEEVWDKPAAEYLKSVTDSGACEWSKYYHWKESYTPEQLKMRIERFLSSENGREISIENITDIKITKRTSGGRVAELVVQTKNSEYAFGKDKIRWAFKRSSKPELILPSARFTIELLRDDAGELIRIDFVGGGYGHGVGMCQCGAMGMSRNGREFKQILSLYYKDTRLVKLY